MLGYVEDEEGNYGLYLGDEEERGRKRGLDSFLPIQQEAKEAEVPERYKKARHLVLGHIRFPALLANLCPFGY